MEKTGKQLSLLLLGLFGFFALTASPAAAQPVVEATVSQTTIYTGEQIELSIEISGTFSDISRPDLPAFSHFRLLSSTPSTARSYNYINGQSSTSYTYSYSLIAEEEGSYTIPAIAVEIDGELIETDPIPVTVIDRNESARSGDTETAPDIFLELQVDDETPVPGQQLVADVVLFFKDGLEVRSYQPIPGWKAEGFWKEELERSGNTRTESTIRNGVRYRKARLLQFALFPTKSGELTISPYEIQISVRSTASRNDPFSSFFGGYGNNMRQVELETDPLTLQVESLPPDPENRYIGAVGSFEIERSISSDEVMVGESVEIETRISGTGNIPLIGKPEYRIPDELEVYSPRERSTVNRTNQRINGHKTFTEVMVARNPGTVTIPEEIVSWYHPERERYVTERLPALTIRAIPNPDAVASSPEAVSLSVQPVTGLATWVSRGSTALTEMWWLWGGLALPLAMLAVGYWQKSYRDRISTDRKFARSVTAYDRAVERLEEAVSRSEEGQIREAYNQLQKSLTGFISDRVGLPEAGLSIQQYVTTLEEEKVDPELVRNVRMLLDKCATISYAPNSTPEYLRSHVSLAKSTLDKLKREL